MCLVRLLYRVRSALDDDPCITPSRIGAASAPLSVSPAPVVSGGLLIASLLRYTAFKCKHDIGRQPELTRETFRFDV